MLTSEALSVIGVPPVPIGAMRSMGVRHSVFSRLFNSGNAVSGSADSSNAADGIDSIGTASLATDNAEPLRLSQVMSFL